jgi:hypothetical protein
MWEFGAIHALYTVELEPTPPPDRGVGANTGPA